LTFEDAMDLYYRVLIKIFEYLYVPHIPVEIFDEHYLQYFDLFLMMLNIVDYHLMFQDLLLIRSFEMNENHLNHNYSIFLNVFDHLLLMIFYKNLSKVYIVLYVDILKLI